MKQAVLVLLVWLCTAVFADAQRHKLATINTDTPEGKALQDIGTESDPGKKLALMEDFVQKYPKHDGTPWLLAQMQDLYTKSGNYDKAIASGEALLQLDPMATQTAYANLKAAEAKKDSDAIVKWSGV